MALLFKKITEIKALFEEEKAFLVIFFIFFNCNFVGGLIFFECSYFCLAKNKGRDRKSYKEKSYTKKMAFESIRQRQTFFVL